MASDNIGFPEAPLPGELQNEIDASIERFRQMFPAMFRAAAEEYVPQYRAEITSLCRRAFAMGKEGLAQTIADNIVRGSSPFPPAGSRGLSSSPENPGRDEKQVSGLDSMYTAGLRHPPEPIDGTE